MSILSIEFLIFIAIILLLYYTCPLKFRWLMLLVGSIVFIIFSGWWSFLHFSMISIITWIGCLYLPKNKKLFVPLLVLDFGAMFLVKYEALYSGIMNDMFGTSIPIWENVAILGLSYYTLQSAGLIIDVYWGKLKPEKNPMKILLFLGYFPQLVQGPISSWKEIGEQLQEGHRLEPERVTAGFILMLWGYFKKLVIADRLAVTTHVLIKGTDDFRGWMIFLFVVLYAIRLYADFSGGMDVIRGISRMLGIDLPENFKRPFFSKSIAEYWRRWHITLGTWFKNYLMFPITNSKFGFKLGKKASEKFGKKVGLSLTTAFATMIVFLMIGIWHNICLTALIYGLYFGFVISVSLLLEPQFKKLNHKYQLRKQKWFQVFQIFRTFLLLIPAQYFAFTTDFDLSIDLIRGTFENLSFSGGKEILLGILSAWQWGIVAISVFMLFVVDMITEKKGNLSYTLAKSHMIVRWPIMILLIFVILVFGVYGAGYSNTEFVYTTF